MKTLSVSVQNEDKQKIIKIKVSAQNEDKQKIIKIKVSAQNEDKQKIIKIKVIKETKARMSRQDSNDVFFLYIILFEEKTLTFCFEACQHKPYLENKLWKLFLLFFAFHET